MQKKDNSATYLRELKNSLSKKTLGDLRVLCKQLGLKGYSRAKKKSQLIEFLISYVTGGDPMKKPDLTIVISKINTIKGLMDEKIEEQEDGFLIFDEDISKKNADRLITILHEMEKIIHNKFRNNPSQSNEMVQEGFYLILTSELNLYPQYIANKLTIDILNINPDPENNQSNSLEISYRPLYEPIMAKKLRTIYSSRIKIVEKRFKQFNGIIIAPEFFSLTLIWYLYFIFTEKARNYFDNINQVCDLTEPDTIRVFKEFEQTLLKLLQLISTLIQKDIENSLDDYCIKFWKSTGITLHPNPWLLFY